jgi:hypothetical protein
VALKQTNKRFQQEVALLLKLPRGAADVDVRDALFNKGGADFLTWYNTRLNAIADSRQAEKSNRSTGTKRREH